MTSEARIGVAGGGYGIERRRGGLCGRERGRSGSEAGCCETAGPHHPLIETIEALQAAVRAGAGALAGARRPAMIWS